MYEVKIGERTYPLERGAVTIGRGAEADIRIDAPKVSSIHARVSVTNDTVYIEDLGSSNGTFVNGARLESGRHPVGPADQVILGNIPCEIMTRAARASTRHPSVRSSRRAAVVKPRSKPSIAKKVIIAGILLVIGLVAFAILTREDPPELTAARNLIAEAGPLMADASVAGEWEAVSRTYAMLNDLKTRLEKIPPEYGDEFTRARRLIEAITVKADECHRVSLVLDRENRARRLLDEVQQGITDGSITADAALRRLRTAAPEWEGTAAVPEFNTLISRLDTDVNASDRVIVSRAHDEAIALARAGSFKEAEARIEQCLNRPFATLKQGEVQKLLQDAVDAIVAMAVEHFHGVAARAVADARDGGDRERLADELTREYKRIGFPELDEEYHRTLKLIVP